MACIYILKQGGTEITFDTKEALVAHIKANNLYDSITVREGTPDKTTATLAAVLRQMAFGQVNFSPKELRDFQSELLGEFMRLEAQSQYFFDIGSAVALTKGLGKDFDQIDNIKKKLAGLGIGGEMKEDVPFDVRYLLTGDPQYRPQNADPYYHKITANNLEKMREIDALSRTMFMERTPSFVDTSNKVAANLKDGLLADKHREMQDELAAFVQVAAYKKWIEMNDKRTTTLRNSLIYDTVGNLPTIVDIAKQAIEIAPDNTFLQFILPVSTVVKVGKKKQRSIINRDLINTIEGKTRGKLEPELIASMMDSFTELYNNPATQFHAKALFDYLIVKDGLMFKNKSFIKLVPTLMFKEMSDATGFATELMAANTMDELRRILNKLRGLEIFDKEGNAKSYFTKDETNNLRDMIKNNSILGVKDALYKKVFGMGSHDLYHTFEGIYATDIRNQFNLELPKTSVKLPGQNAAKKPEGYSWEKVDNVEYLHVSLFPEGIKKFEKGSDERKKYFKQVVDELNDVKFFVVTPKDEDGESSGKSYVQYKKHIRIRQQGAQNEFGEREKATYTTYRLVSVERDGKLYSGAAMTVDGELVPRGTKAVYAPVEAVGASNTIGVANLGARPTRDQILATIAEKIKRDDDKGGDDNGGSPTDPFGSLPPDDAPTPGMAGGFFSDESGMAFTLPNSEPISGGEGLQDQYTKGAAITVNPKLVVQLKATPAFKNEAVFLSNFAPYQKGEEHVYDGVSYPSNEHFYQAMKVTDKEARKRIAAHGFEGLKAFVRTQGKLRPDWEQIKDKVMMMGLEHKFAQSRLKSLLLSTGNEDLVERNTWGDTYWGVANGKGENKLGKMLMEIRSKLRGSTPIVQQGSLFTAPAKETPPQAPQNLADIFGQLGQAPYDPNTDGPIQNFSKEDVDKDPC